MANTKWCYNSLTGEMFSYQESGGLTDFPRGDFLAYGDYLTVGFKTRKDAEDWAKEWGHCKKCKRTAHKTDDGICSLCKKEKIIFMGVKTRG